MLRRPLAIVVFSALAFAAPAVAQNPYTRLKAVRLTQYAKAPGYSEGPTWYKGDLFFCSGQLMRVDADGRVEKYLDIGPAGTVLRGDGHLLICDNKHHALLDLSPDGVLAVLADHFEGKPLKSLNDLTIDARGNVWWTDPEGSTADNPIGSVFRVRPDGVISRVATGLAFPNGLDVDPAGKFLYLIESQSKKILRYAIPNDDQPLGKPELFFNLGGSGGDGCVFDAAGNFWVADFHRPETKHGRITVLSPQAKVLGAIEVPAEVVSNITFGGPDYDEIFCTTGGPPGVFHVKVGIKGFRGHPGKPGTVVRTIPIAPEEPASPVSPRRFGSPGGIAGIRGWYIWRKWDPETRQVEVAHEGTGEVYRVRVLPWLTTYRHLVYGARPDDLLPGERVNLFFAPDERHSRGYLVHFQDEIGQMHGHKHVWEVRSVSTGGREFGACVLAGDKPFDERERLFEFDTGCTKWHDGKKVDRLELKASDRMYLTWRLEGGRRLVRLVADAASLEALRKEEQERINRLLVSDGLTGKLEAVERKTVRYLAFATHWPQANSLWPGQQVVLRRTDKVLRPTGEAIEAKVAAQKNRGAYGSGVNDVVLELLRSEDARTVEKWTGDGVVRLIPAPSPHVPPP
jgi:gluconolactonase